MQDEQVTHDTQDGTHDAAPSRQVEAARYALLRRLASPMRHDMVVHLQPIGMISEVMERRLLAPSPDLAQVHEGMKRINGFSRAAVRACLDVVSWLAPEDGTVVALDEGVQECVTLLRGSFNFRGFNLQDQTGPAPFPVARAALRNVLPACLLALTDRAVSPADVTLSAQDSLPAPVLKIALRAKDAVEGFTGNVPYRVLEWSEVEALAQAEGIAVARDGDTVRLTLPLAPA